MLIPLEGCSIRSWRKTDFESLAENANNPKIWRNVRDAFPHPYTETDARQWIEHATTEKPEVSFAIAVDDSAVGGIGLVLQADVSRVSAEIGYWLGEKYWGRGIATQAVEAMTAYGFATFNLTRIFAHVFEWNSGSQRVLQKCGYHLEGRLRRAAIKEGQVIDELLFANILDAD